MAVDHSPLDHGNGIALIGQCSGTYEEEAIDYCKAEINAMLRRPQNLSFFNVQMVSLATQENASEVTSIAFGSLLKLAESTKVRARPSVRRSPRPDG
jgi:hypothetical protein